MPFVAPAQIRGARRYISCTDTANILRLDKATQRLTEIRFYRDSPFESSPALLYARREPVFQSFQVSLRPARVPLRFPSTRVRSIPGPDTSIHQLAFSPGNHL